MNIEQFREFCLSFPGTSESLPFGPDTLVYKVGNKMFALTDIDAFSSINVKCDPEHAIDLRGRYPEIKPGYHMNKRHWNTIDITTTINDEQYFVWIKNSYDLVYKKLTKREKLLIENS